jgi:hypothetical protein
LQVELSNRINLLFFNLGENMKKLIIAIAAFTIASFASAIEIDVSKAHDFKAKADGVRVEAQVDVFKVPVTASYTTIDKKYNRYAVGAEYGVAKIGPVALAVTGSVVYQDTYLSTSKDGYGLTAGAIATLPLVKNISLFASTEVFAGQKRINAFNGNTGTIGLTAKF